MIETATTVALMILSVCVLLCLYRLVIGPNITDRVISLDATMIIGIAISIVVAIKYDTGLYLDVALVIAVLAFVGTVAIAKFLIRGKIID